MKKIIKITSSILLAITIIVTSIMNVNAASDSISIGTATKVHNNYIANVTFSYKVTTDGKYLYCLDLHRNTASNVQAKLVSNSSYVDGGLLYILKNGYPNKSITGDSDKDYYITQTAVWWYLDSTRGASNLGEKFKKTGSDPYNLRHYVHDLVNEGIAHKYDSTSVPETKLSIAPTNGGSLTLQNGYYISNDIKAVTSNIDKYKVTINNPVKGTIIIGNHGREFTYNGPFELHANESFKVKVPSSSITSTTTTFTVEANAAGNTEYKAYEYQPVDSKMQNVVLLEKNTTTVKSSTKLTIDSTQLTITKIDSKTKKPLAGAQLVLKDSNGKVISTWTSTINGHIIKNLSEGTYTIEETKAPEGYVLNKKVTTVKITKNVKEYKVTMENTPKNIVVNINKVDQETNKPLKGAVLVVKDSKGNIIDRFTTTESAHVITKLANGVYTVEEESAPEGYIKSNEKITFTVDDNHQSHQITMVNAKEVIVPNTGTESIIFALIGTIILGIGLDYILKHAKA